MAIPVFDVINGRRMCNFSASAFSLLISACWSTVPLLNKYLFPTFTTNGMVSKTPLTAMDASSKYNSVGEKSENSEISQQVVVDLGMF